MSPRCKESLKVKQAMRHINTFRNRFAHVPFPYDPLDKVANALENATEQLFSVAPLPSKHAEKSDELGSWRSSPLTGALGIKNGVGKFLLRGNTHFPSDTEFEGNLSFVFPCLPPSNDYELERWDSSPLMHVDEMMRPYVITRIKEKEEHGSDYIGQLEYIRFRAEANAVIVLRNITIPSGLIPPKPSEYAIEDEEVNDAPSTMDEAIQAAREGDFDSAIKFFENLTEEKPSYHIAWLRLGYAKREKAVRMSDDLSERAVNLLKESETALNKAKEHKDREYQARAYYELSKTHFQLAKKIQGREQLHVAFEDAKEACLLSADTKYQSWLEYIQHNIEERDGFNSDSADKD